MRILIEASVMEEPATGIAKVIAGLYHACLGLRPDLQLFSVHRRSRPGQSSVPPRVIRIGRFLTKRQWESCVPSVASVMFRADVLHFPWNGNVPRLVGKRTVVTTLHDVLPLVLPDHFASQNEERDYRRRIQRDIDRTDLLVTDSTYSRDQIVNNFRPRVVPMVIPLASTLPSLDRVGTSKSAPYGKFFLYVGGYNQRKGLVSLLRLFLKLKEEGRIASTLVITGQKKFITQEFETLIEGGVREGWVAELGYVSDPVLASLYRDSMALIFPSKFEGFGLPPLEAMSLGCPVITTRGTAIPEVCGEAAYYIDPDDPKEFAQSLIDLETQPHIRPDLRAKGLQQATKFSWTRSAELFLESLDKVHASRKGMSRNL
jgi:glycosyltransferase involved in cell wall biosynthesis